MKSNPFKQHQDLISRRDSLPKVKLSDIHNSKIEEEEDEFEENNCKEIKGFIRLEDYVSSNYKSTKADKYEVSSPILSVDSENEDEPIRRDTISSRFLALIEV